MRLRFRSLHRRQASIGRAAGLGFLVAIAAISTGARAQPAPLWGEIRLVGGVPAARHALGLGDPAGRTDAEWLMDAIYRFGTIGVWAQSADRLDRYAQALSKVQNAALLFPEGVRLLPVTAPKDRRDEVKDFLELLGVRVKEDRGRLLTEVADAPSAAEIAGWLKEAGINRTELVTRLNAGDTVTIRIVDAVLPLPLPAFWRSAHPDIRTAVDLLRDRTSALMYAGLLSQDEETLKFFSDRSALLQRIAEDAAPAFAAFGRSLHVRQGVVNVPGGADAEPLWRDLTDKPANDPDAFIRRLLTRDGGRLAYFFDAVDRLDAARQRFVLGTGLTGRARLAEFTTIYSWFEIDSTWDLSSQPFSRPLASVGPDPAFVLDMIDLDTTDAAGPAWFPSLLDQVASSTDWPDKPDRAVKSLKDASANASWVLSWIFDKPSESKARFRMLRFAQRQFSASGRADLPFIDSALRAFRDMPVLALSLERMGVADPAIWAAVARGAHALTESGDRTDAELALTRWQSALALVEQIHRRRRLPPAVLNRLLQSLSDIALQPRDQAGGLVATWVVSTLVPAFVPPDTAAPLAESLAVRAFSGTSDNPVRLTWDGLPYIVNDHGVVAKSVAALRAAAAAPSLGDLLILETLRARLERGFTTLDELRTYTAELEAARGSARLVPASIVAPEAVADTFDGILKALKSISKPKDLAKASRQAAVLSTIVGVVSDAVVRPLVYALAISPLSQPAAVYAEAWVGHVILPADLEQTTPWKPVAWKLPTSDVRRQGGTILRGAWLGIDLALADSRLPRVTDDTMSSDGPSEAERASILSAVVLYEGRAVGDGKDLRDVVDSLARGRALLATWAKTAPSFASSRTALVDAGVDGWRANAVAWELARRPEGAAEGLTLTELTRLGGQQDVPTPWSASSLATDGCWCLRSPGHRARDAGRVYWRLGGKTAIATDLPIRLAEYLAAAKLPMSLVNQLMPAATADWLGHAAGYAPSDWVGLTAWPRRLEASRIDRYLLRLISDGVLAPPENRQP